MEVDDAWENDGFVVLPGFLDVTAAAADLDLKGHPYWTPKTLARVALRYPALDMSAWKAG